MKITLATTSEEIINLTSECNKCGHCCSFGSGYLIEEDFETLAKHLDIDVETLKKDYLEEVTILTKILHKPKLIHKESKFFGSCIFLKDGICDIHSVKPFYCKLGSGCKNEADLIWQWFLHHHVIGDSKSAIDEYDKLLLFYKDEGKPVISKGNN